MISWSRRNAIAGLVSAPAAAGVLGQCRRSLAADALERITLVAADARSLAAALAVPASTPAPGVVLLHGGSGLGALSHDFAQRLAHHGFLVLAPDLFDGRVPKDEETRRILISDANANPSRTLSTIVASIDWLRKDPRVTGKVGVVGYLDGAGWAIDASVAAPVDATVAYVGLRYPDMETLAALSGPILVHLGERDPDVTPGHVKFLEKAMADAGKSLQVHWYPGDHFFAFPTYPSYDQTSAEAAMDRTVAFLHAQLR
jgi:carboxymethylenebutenolidase